MARFDRFARRTRQGSATAHVGAGEGRAAVRGLGRRRRDLGAGRPATSTTWDRRPSTGRRDRATGSASSPGPSAPRRSTRWPARARPGRSQRGSGGQPVRDPGAGARGVPDRLRRLAGHGLPGAAGLGRDLRPGAGARDGARIGAAMRRLGVHQGLAPVLDVARDQRWGRVEETIGEDPYLVGTIGAAYVAGLESAGIVATLKHFAGYSASRAGPQPRAGLDRPAGAGRRDPAAVRDGAARRRPLGDELLHRHRRCAGRRRPGAADRPAARRPGASPAPSSRTTSPSPSCSACTASPAPRARPPRWRWPPGSTSSCRPSTASARRCSPRWRPARSTWRWSTGRWSGCCRRSASSGLLDADWSPEPPILSEAGAAPRRRPVPRPGPAPGTALDRACCATRTARCRWPRASAWRSSGPAHTSRTRPSAATRSPGTSACTIPRSPSASRHAPSWRRCKQIRRAIRSPTRRAARYRTPRALCGCAPSARRPRATASTGRRRGRRGAACAGRSADRRSGRGGARGGAVRRSARRRFRPVRQRHLRRGLRRLRPAPARTAGRAVGGAAGHRDAGGPGAAGRPPLRAVPLRRPARRGRLRLPPRRGGRERAGGRAGRARGSGRTAAGEFPADGGEPALDVPHGHPGPAQRCEHGGPHAAVSLRARPVLQPGGVGGRRPYRPATRGRRTARSGSRWRCATTARRPPARWSRSTCTTRRPRWRGRSSS